MSNRLLNTTAGPATPYNDSNIVPYAVPKKQMHKVKAKIVINDNKMDNLIVPKKLLKNKNGSGSSSVNTLNMFTLGGL